MMKVVRERDAKIGTTVQYFKFQEVEDAGIYNADFVAKNKLQE